MELLGSMDVHGLDGQRGRDGRNIRDIPRSPGTRGFPGGDATPASPGQDAGSVQCRLQFDGQSNQFRIEANITQADGKSGASQQSFPIGQTGYLFFDAHGGRGGDGGQGGHGGPGSRGDRGRNATRYSSGANGGPGGDGGDAGEPSDGNHGGKGGEVQLIVDRSETGLLMLVKGNLAQGSIGFAGEPGHGGMGGAGGAGGRSYHWTETRSYRDSQGNSRTRVIMRSNPGGIDGRRGRDGRPSRYRAADASPGQAGELKILVREPNGTLTSYRSPYDLELVTFDVVGEYGILEPDSLVSIDRLVLRNRGGMPTPENFTVKVFLPSDDWIQREGIDMTLNRSIPPGETHTFEDHALRLRLADYCVDRPRKRAFRLRHPLCPQARLESGINRPFRSFENSEDIFVRFPVELTAITCLNSLAPGESTRVIWGLTNTSEQTFDQKYLYRAVRSQLRHLGGDLTQEIVVFFDTEDQEHDLGATEFEKRIGELSPGQRIVIETRIGVRDVPEAIPYQGFVVGVDLDLQRPKSSERSDQFRRVDYRKTFIRVSEKYRRDPGARFLLVANQKTTTRDIEKWTQLADYFGSDLDVWDVSYYGFLDLVRAVDQDKSLLQQWEDMTLIIPNNYYNTPHGPTVAFSQLAKGQFLRAAADYNINFYIVGDSRTGGAEMLATSLIPVDDGKSPSQLKTQKEFLRAVIKWNNYVARSQQVVGGVTSNSQEIADATLGDFHEFDIRKRTFLFQPTSQWLEAEAKRLQRKLSKDDPLHRWVVVHRYDTRETDTSWGFFRKREVGKFEVYRTLDSTKGSAVLFEVDGIDAIDRDFITSKANKHGIFLALKFEDKVDRFIRLVGERTFPRYSEQYIERPMTDEEVREIGRELVDSILTDLYNEQKTARTCRTWGRGGIRSIMPKLNYLAERSLNYGVTYKQMLENEVSLNLLYELLANLYYMAEQSRTLWDLAVFPTAFFKRSRAVSNYMVDRADRITTNIFGRAPSWWDRITSSGDDYDPFGTAKKQAPQGIARQTANQRVADHKQTLLEEKPSIKKYETAQAHPGLTYDPELLSEAVRVMPGWKYDELVQAERQATRQRYETEQAVQSKRSDLLVPLVTEQEMQQPTPRSQVSVNRR